MMLASSELQTVVWPGIIDVWANYWPRELFVAYPKLGNLYRRVGLESRMGRSIEQLVVEAEAAGVAKVIVSSAEFAGSPSTNACLAAEIADFQGMLIGCGSVDPSRGDPSGEVSRCVEEYGFAAIKVIPFFAEIPPDDDVYMPIYAACERLGVPVQILTGHTAVMSPSCFGQPLRIDKIALAHPELTIIAGHAGYPWTDELISVAWKHDNVHIETSGHRPKHWPVPLVTYLSTYGGASVMFGSGFPMMPYAQLTGDLEALSLSPDRLAGLLRGNAARIFSLETL